MEQKKLTDEELAKALLQSIEYSKTITYFDIWGNCKSIFITDIIDFIARLQAENAELKSNKFANWKVKFFKAKEEIERLTEALGTKTRAWESTNEMCNTVLKENAELQKQVDELKESANGHLLTSLYKKQADDHKRAISKQRNYWEKKVKQAVKDTAKEVLAIIKGYDEEDYLQELEKAIAKRYGLEVE